MKKFLIAGLVFMLVACLVLSVAALAVTLHNQAEMADALQFCASTGGSAIMHEGQLYCIKMTDPVEINGKILF